MPRPNMGNHIPDFCCPKPKLIIELDGGQHLEQDASQYDEERTNYFKSQGYQVIRFWNNQVLRDIKGAIKSIMNAAYLIEWRTSTREGGLRYCPIRTIVFSE